MPLSDGDSLSVGEAVQEQVKVATLHSWSNEMYRLHVGGAVK